MIKLIQKKTKRKIFCLINLLKLLKKKYYKLYQKQKISIKFV
jgi:hypothetical protein